MKLWILLLSILWLLPTPGTAHAGGWKKVQKDFVHTKRTGKILRQFRAALTDKEAPVVILAGIDDREKMELIEIWMDTFDAGLQFGSPRLLKNTPPDAALDEAAVVEATRVQFHAFQKNKDFRMGTAVVLSTSHFRSVTSPKFNSFLDFLGPVYREMANQNRLRPATPIHVVIESKWNPDELVDRLEAKGIKTRVVDFSRPCDDWLIWHSHGLD